MLRFCQFRYGFKQGPFASTRSNHQAKLSFIYEPIENWFHLHELKRPSKSRLGPENEDVEESRQLKYPPYELPSLSRDFHHGSSNYIPPDTSFSSEQHTPSVPVILVIAEHNF